MFLSTLCSHVFVCGYVHAKAHMERSRDSLRKAVLSSFHHMSPKDGTQVIGTRVPFNRMSPHSLDPLHQRNLAACETFSVLTAPLLEEILSIFFPCLGLHLGIV